MQTLFAHPAPRTIMIFLVVMGVGVAYGVPSTLAFIVGAASAFGSLVVKIGI